MTPQEPTWTKEPPKEAGLYFWMPDLVQAGMQVLRVHPDMCVLVVISPGYSSPVHVEDIGAGHWWSARIEEPPR